MQLPVSSDSKKKKWNGKLKRKGGESPLPILPSVAHRTTVHFRRDDSFNVGEKMSLIVLMADESASPPTLSEQRNMFSPAF